MAEMLNNMVADDVANRSKIAAKELRVGLDAESNIGHLLAINFEEAKVLAHDYARQVVQGLPHGSFLVATRMNLDEEISADDEYCCLVLLRIIGDYRLPNAVQMEEYRFQAGKRATGSEENWDAPKTLDDWTKDNLSYGGYACRVLGTFRMKKNESGDYKLDFGADIINYYCGEGMKVYKPKGSLLSKIVNYQKIFGNETISNIERPRIGRVRFSSSEISIDENLYNVSVQINPTDFVSRRTFYGGMSRGGKSNAMKITARAVYLLRKNNPESRVGQLIFDQNGEYANENVQDGSGSALRLVSKEVKGTNYDDEIVTYGLNSHPNDENRKIVKTNFYGQHVSNWGDLDGVEKSLEQLFVGKEIISGHLAESGEKYISSFRDTHIIVPDVLSGHGDQIRLQREVEVYRAILHSCGFKPKSENVKIKGLFGKDLRESMNKSGYSHGAEILGADNTTWENFAEGCKILFSFMEDKKWNDFDSEYRRSHDGRSWDRGTIRDILQIYKYPNGVRSLKPLLQQHSANVEDDYAAQIVEHLRKGKLVIFDQSTGDPLQNQKAAERILWAIFNRQKADFIDPKVENGVFIPPSPVMVYLEEAHNLLPAAGGKDELKTIWARTAKEGSKYKIGMVLATQEPSSVMPSILKNTDNWFIAHLNNSDEIKTLSKFYDFGDYSNQIKMVTDPGFVRMRTLSNPFTIPVQVDLFSIEGDN